MAAASDRVVISDLPDGKGDAEVTSIFGAYGNIKSVCMLPGQNTAIVHFASQNEATWVVENLHGNIAQGLTTPISCRYAGPQDGKGGGGCKGGGGGARFDPYAGKGGGQGGGWGGGCGGGGCGGCGGGGGKGWTPCAGGGGKGLKEGKCSVQTLKKGLAYAGVIPGGKWSNDENALFVSGLPGDTTDLDMYEIFAPFGAIPTKGVRAMNLEDGTCKGFGFVNFLSKEAAHNAISILNGTMMPDGSTLRVMPKGPSKPREGK